MRVAARALVLVALAGAACSGHGAHADAPPKTTRGSAPLNKQDRPADVKSLLALRAHHRRDLMTALELAPGDVREDVAYQKLAGVARLHNAAVYPAHFYVRGDDVEVVYIGNPDFLRALTPAAIHKELGGDGVRLRSRAGKTANQYVYPEAGFAYSETHGALDFVEIFRPMSIDAYRATIYEDPGEFTK